MALTSALFSGLSGLDANQTWLNVIGNNIANLNTTAFKSSSVQFSPQFYVTDQPGTVPDSNFGGTNPSQEGMGTQVASVQTNFSAGSIQSTGVDTNLAINGDGFFVVSLSGNQEFTRDGSFSLNSTNQLVTSTGAFVQGYGVDTSGNILTGSLQNITIPMGSTTTAKATGNVTMQGNLNSSGQVAGGSSILNSQSVSTLDGSDFSAATNLVNLANTGSATPLVAAGDVLTVAGTRGSGNLAPQTLTVTASTTVGDLQNFFNGALGIDTTVAEPGLPTPGATIQADGSSGQLTIIGNSGSDNAITLGDNGVSDSSGVTPFTFAAGADGTFTSNPSGESTNTTITAYDSLGTPISVNITAVLESESSTGNTWRFYASSPDNESGTQVVGNGTLTFNSSGQLASATGTTISIDRTGSGAATPLSMNLNFSGVTSLASTDSNIVMSSQDGSAAGNLTSFSVGQDGTITGTFSNGLTKPLGQVAVAMFNNPQGMVNQGGNYFIAGADSGTPMITAPESEGSGGILAGSLEQSNVDLSKEFTNMIIASTGFSANSRVITTSNQLLTDLLNSSR